MQGIAQINLASCDGLSEMQLRWYSVQVFTSPELPRARERERARESGTRDPPHTTATAVVTAAAAAASTVVASAATTSAAAAAAAASRKTVRVPGPQGSWFLLPWPWDQLLPGAVTSKNHLCTLSLRT